MLGAGASVPYGFSAGRELVDDIIDNAAKPNHPLNEALKTLGYSRERLGEFVAALDGSQLDSIDSYVANNDTAGARNETYAGVNSASPRIKMPASIPLLAGGTALVSKMITGSGLVDISHLTFPSLTSSL